MAAPRHCFVSAPRQGIRLEVKGKGNVALGAQLIGGLHVCAPAVDAADPAHCAQHVTTVRPAAPSSS